MSFLTFITVAIKTFNVLFSMEMKANDDGTMEPNIYFGVAYRVVLVCCDLWVNSRK